MESDAEKAATIKQFRLAVRESLPCKIEILRMGDEMLRMSYDPIVQELNESQNLRQFALRDRDSDLDSLYFALATMWGDPYEGEDAIPLVN